MRTRQRLATRSNPADTHTSTCLLCGEPIYKNAGLWAHSTTFVDCDRHKEWKDEFER